MKKVKGFAIPQHFTEKTYHFDLELSDGKVEAEADCVLLNQFGKSPPALCLCDAHSLADNDPDGLDSERKCVRFTI